MAKVQVEVTLDKSESATQVELLIGDDITLTKSDTISLTSSTEYGAQCFLRNGDNGDKVDITIEQKKSGKKEELKKTDVTIPPSKHENDKAFVFSTK